MKTIPERMCVVCRTMKPKNLLVRVVKDNEGNISLDYTGKKAGRGAYICNDLECVQKCAKTKALNRAFKCEIGQGVYDDLIEQFSNNQQD